MIDYQLRAAKLLQASLRAANWQPDPPPKPTPKPTPKPRAIKPAQPDLWRIAERIMLEVGNCVPDGDPIDHLAPFCARLGIDRYDVYKWLDKASRKHLGVRSYDEYLADMWDAYNEGCEPEQRVENPWR